MLMVRLKMSIDKNIIIFVYQFIEINSMNCIDLYNICLHNMRLYLFSFIFHVFLCPEMG